MIEIPEQENWYRFANPYHSDRQLFAYIKELERRIDELQTARPAEQSSELGGSRGEHK